MVERSVRAELADASKSLEAAGRATPRVDAELLLSHVLGIPRTGLVRAETMSSTDVTSFEELVRRRADGAPLQHLTGTAPFRHIDLAVGPGVFIPRPETELILDVAAARLVGGPLVVDLCAGSGAIALAVAHENPTARVIAVEYAAQARQWLGRNIELRARAGDTPTLLVAADVRAPSLTGLEEFAGMVDVVLSNPPYVPERMRPQLSMEVGHDPDDAIFAGPDGLALMRPLITAAAGLLSHGGMVVIEHDDSHGEAVPRLLVESEQWTSIADHADLAGRPRFASAIRR